MHVLRQAEYAVRVGAGEIGLQHQLGDLGGVAGRHAGFDHGVGDQAAHGGSRVRVRASCASMSGFPAESFAAWPAEDRGLVGVGNLQAAHVRDAIQHGHVVGVIAAEHDIVGADQADHRFQRLVGMQDGVVDEALGDVVRLLA